MKRTDTIGERMAVSCLVKLSMVVLITTGIRGQTSTGKPQSKPKLDIFSLILYFENFSAWDQLFIVVRLTYHVH